MGYWEAEPHGGPLAAVAGIGIVWYGSVRTPFTYDFAEEVLRTSGFGDIRRCEDGQTTSGDHRLAELDNRPRESLFVEARKAEWRYHAPS